MDDVTARLTEYVVALDPARISPKARAEVGRRLVDSLACALGGLDSEPVEALRQVARRREQPGGCTVWGSRSRTTAEFAALANATAVRFLDYSDYTVGGHPSDNIAAVIAACEWADRTVDDLVAGVLVNYEVFGELGRLLIRYRGWDQGTTAVIAATCGVGKVLGLTADQLASAIGMVATGNIATGKARRGELTMWKGVAGPYAAACAVVAAEMARAGITAPHDAFSGEFGFWEQVSGEFEIERLDPTDGAHYIYKAAYKHWPVQFDVQPAVWLGAQIRDHVQLDQVTAVAVETSDWTWKGTANDPAKWDPATRETADHSLPFILAVALHRGSISSDDFDSSSVADERYRRVMSRITVRAAADITAEALDYIWMRAVVTLADGSRKAFEVKESRTTTMTDDQLRAKWHLLVDGSRLAGDADQLFAALAELRGDQPVRELFAPMATDAP
jgi:2-methylcitrate dehydratase